MKKENPKRQATATESPAFSYVGQPYDKCLYYRGQFIDPRSWSSETIQSFIAQYPDTEGWFKTSTNEANSADSDDTDGN